MALLLPLLLACTGPDQPTDLPDSERPTGESETRVSPAQTRSTRGPGASPTPTGALATASPSASGSAETDLETLVALYHATDGPNWTNKAHWLSDRPLGEWYGITTDASGRVTELLLDGNRLSGGIPTELGSLANLRMLDLNVNQLSGPIPSSLESLANLQELSLNGNQLSGGIPTELGSLANLRWTSAATS